MLKHAHTHTTTSAKAAYISTSYHILPTSAYIHTHSANRNVFGHETPQEVRVSSPPQSLRKASTDIRLLKLSLMVFLSYLPEAGQYSCFFLYLRQVSGILSRVGWRWYRVKVHHGSNPHFTWYFLETAH